MALYRGFSTVNPLSQKKFRLTDFELIKQDLLNNLNTRLGGRVMQPKFGCIIWELLFEPLTDSVKQELYDNLASIVNSDPRVHLASINITTDQPNTIIAELGLTFTDTNQLERMIVQFDATGVAAAIA